jgi:natural product precursor
MKKKISSKLTLGKRSVATLSDESMSLVDGGGYSASCGATCGCPPPSACCPSMAGCGGGGSGTYAAYTQPRCC